MPTCPVPHSPREQFWLATGLVVGVAFGRIIRRFFASPPTTAVVAQVPNRLFKLATSAEIATFTQTGRIESSLDQKDRFVHLSDRTSPPNVARLFFDGAKDLHLIELNADLLTGPVQWMVGPVGTAPSAGTLAAAPTVVHYDHSCGCVHVYGASVSTAAVVRTSQALELDDDGVHRMPLWL